MTIALQILLAIPNQWEAKPEPVKATRKPSTRKSK